MKKIILTSLALCFYSFFCNAQDSSGIDFNKFSLEIGAGTNKLDDNFAPGFFQSNEDEEFALNGIRYYRLGARYMFNDKFGLKLDAGLNIFQNETDASLEFESRQGRVSVEGVANLGNALNFSSFTGRFGLLAHAGLQISQLYPESRRGNDISDYAPETDGGLIVGITPQFRITDRIAVNYDISYIHNFRTHFYWDGAYNYTNYERNLNSSLFNFSFGVTFYLGEHDVHADWIDTHTLLEDRVVALEGKLDDIEKDMEDSDRDGVPNYLDREPNTTSGVAVNSKGEAVDLNNNGIPDELERPLEDKYVSKEYAKENNYSMSGIDDVKPDANDELIHVYFKFNSTQPEFYSLNSIDRIVRYMKKYPETNAVLTGYTDQIGPESYNIKLSEERAKTVYEIVIASGIDESRLTYKGGGVDDSKDKDSAAARQIARRVSFRLK